MPNLIEVQQNSYRWFLETGLQELFDDISPIQVLTIWSGVCGVSLVNPNTRRRDQGKGRYYAPLRVKVRTLNKETGEVNETDAL